MSFPLYPIKRYIISVCLLAGDINFDQFVDVAFPGTLGSSNPLAVTAIMSWKGTNRREHVDC